MNVKLRICTPWLEFGPPARTRLLLFAEDPNPARGMAEFRRFEEAGFDVALCSGPCDGCVCPLKKGGACRLVEAADLVLMGPGVARHRAVVAAMIQHSRPGLPIVVQMLRGDSGQCPPACVPSYFPVSVDGQIRSLWRVLDRPTPPHPSAAPRPQPAATGPQSTSEPSTEARLLDLLGW